LNGYLSPAQTSKRPKIGRDPIFKVKPCYIFELGAVAGFVGWLQKSTQNDRPNTLYNFQERLQGRNVMSMFLAGLAFPTEIAKAIQLAERQ
jgi:hypothetical protein